jgi:hypothetical protein
VTAVLDLFDIQGEVTRPYVRFGFPVSRYLFLQVTDGEHGREFVGKLTAKVTTAANWDAGRNAIPMPKATTNISFTYLGLKALGVPRASLVDFPPEFSAGMKARREILGDDGPSA